MSEELNNNLETPTEPTPPKTSYTDEEIQKILATSKAVREEKKEAERKYKQAEESLKKVQEIDPGKYQEALLRQQELEDASLQRQQVYSQRQAQWDQERSKLTATINDLQGSLQETKIRHSLETAFYAGGGRKGMDDYGQSCFDMIYPQMRKFIEVDENGRTYVVDPQGRQPLLNEKGEKKTIKDIVTLLRENEVTMSMFEADRQQSGMGTTNGGRTPRKGAADIKLDRSLGRAERLSLLRNME